MAFQLAIFDFDGTLADSFPCFLAALNDAASRFGFRAIDAADVERLRGYSSWQVMEHIDVATWQLPMITQFVRARMAESVESVSLFPGMHEVLEDLDARGVRIAIVSSSTEETIRRVLGPRLASLVQDYRCSVSMFGRRPKLRQVLAATHVARARAVAIGDEVRDLRAARSEDIAFAAVTWGFTAAPALVAAEPDYIFQHVDDLADAIAGPPTLPVRRG